jgi:hypothetical protein
VAGFSIEEGDRMTQQDLSADFAALLDDAALFPPGNAPMDVAVAAHQRLGQGPAASLLGPFVVTASRLSEMADAASRAGAAAVETSVIIDAHLDLNDLPPAIAVVALEVAVHAAPDPRAALEHACSVAGKLPLFVEVGWGEHAQAYALAAIERGASVKLRTGGVVADAFPSAGALADMIVMVAAHHGSYKCTAGLHHAVRHTDAVTGFRHHGFLNVFAAAACEGTTADARAILDLDDGPELAALVRSLSPRQRLSARSQFRSFGSCSILEPLGDLVWLGLIPAAVLPTAAS